MNESEERARKALLDLLPQDSAPDWSEVRTGAGQRKRPRLRAGRVGGAAGGLAAVAATIVGLVLMLPGGDTDRSTSPATTDGTTTAAPAPPAGELTFAAIQATIADFNARYSECMEANGATLVSYPEDDAWSWAGATDTATRVCAPLLRAGEDYMRQKAVREVVSRPDYFKFLKCLNPVLRVLPPSDRFTAKEEAAAKRCSEGLNG